MATWTEPKTWSAERSKLSDWNTYLQQNTEAIKNPPTGLDNGTSGIGTLYTSSSASFVDINASLSKTIVTGGGDILVVFRGAFSGAASSCLDITLDGARQGGSDGLLTGIVNALSVGTIPLIWLITDVTAGSHTIALQWKTTSTINLVQNPPHQFVVREAS